MMFPFVSRKKYDELAFKLECLLCEATGNRLSKHTYSLQTMLRAVVDHQIESYDEAVEEAIKDYKKGSGLAKEIIEEIKSKSGVCYASANDVEIYGTRRYSIMATELDKIEKKYTEGEG